MDVGAVTITVVDFCAVYVDDFARENCWHGFVFFN